MDKTDSKTILLVEDEFLIAMDEQMTLEDVGYKVIIAGSGEDAIKMVQTNPTIDLILMDIDLGKGMDGTEAAAIILQDRDLPVVFLSSHTEPEIVDKTEKITSYGYIVKGLSDTVLLASIKMAFRLFDAKANEKKQEKALKHTKSLLSNAFDSSLASMFICESKRNGDGEIVDFIFMDLNTKAEQMLQMNRESLIGKNMCDVLPINREAGFFEKYKQVVDTGDPLEEEFFLPETHVPAAWYHHQVTPTSNGIFIQHHDITERKRSEELLRNLDHEKSLILDNSNEIIAFHDTERRLIWANNAYLRGISEITGALQTLEDIKGRKCYEAWGLQQFCRDCPVSLTIKTGVPEQGTLTPENQENWPEHQGYWGISAAPVRNAEGVVIGAIEIAQNITEQKQAQKAFQLTSERLQALLDHSPLLISEIDHQGCYRLVNRAASAVFGLAPSAVIGRKLSDFLPPETVNVFMTRVAKVMKSGRPLTVEDQLETEDGVKTFSTTIFPYYHGTATIQSIAAIAHDCTEQRLAEAKLRENEDWYRRFMKNTPDILYRYSSKEGALFWSDRVRDILGYDPEELKKDPLIWNRSIHPDDRSRVDLAIQDQKKGERYDIDYRIKTKDGRWIWLNDRIISKIVLEDEVIIEGHAADITGRKEAEKALEKERWRLNAILEGTRAGTWEWNVQTGGTTFNERWAEMIGYTLAEISPVSIDTWTKFTHPEDLKTAEEQLKQVFEKERDYYDCEFRMRHRNGDWVWVRDRGKVVTWTADDQPLLMAGTHQDLSVRKRAEEETARFKTIFDKAVFGNAIADLDGKLVYINQYFAKVHGYEPEELVGQPLSVFHTQKQIPEVERAITRMMAHGHHETKEIWHVHRDGTEFPMLMSGVLLRDEHSKAQFMATSAVNITDLKQTEAMLQASEEKYRRLFETMSQGVIHQAAGGIIISANPAASQLLGLSVDEISGKTCMDPRWKMIMEDGTEISGTEHPSEIALRTGRKIGPVTRGVYIPEKNEYLWLSMIATPLFRPGEDQPYQSYAVFEDITTRKQAEQALRESEERLAVILNSMPDMVVQVDRDMRIQWANSAALDLTPNAVGQTCYQAFPGRESICEGCPCRQAFSSGQIETKIMYQPASKTAGESYWENTGVPLTNPEGKTVSVFEISRNITERVKAEQQIKVSLQEKEVLLKETHHRIKNNIAMIASLLSIQQRSSTNSEVKAGLNEAIGRIRSMTKLYEKMLIADDYQSISSASYFSDLAGAIIALFPERSTIKTTERFEDFRLSSKKAFLVGIILNELLTNTMKYAFVDRDAGLIDISLSKNENRVTLTIKDNGVGIRKDGDEISSHFGLNLVRMLAEQLDGEFTLEDHQGTKSVLTFAA
jgi:PAS domain S-box-containing protein